MEEYEELINEYIANYYSFVHDENKKVFSLLPVIRTLFLYLEGWLTDFFNAYNFEIDWAKISKADFLEKERIINDFYKSLKVDFNMEEIINNGTFEVFTHSLEEAFNNHDYFLCGKCGKCGNDPIFDSIVVNNNGLVTDAIVWVHEITHYRNSSKIIRTEISDLLTESISFAYELIFLDYIEKLGYKYEAAALRNSIFYSLFYHTYNSYFGIQLLTVYQQFGIINEENYTLMYSKEVPYDLVLEEFVSIFNDNDKDILFFIQYGLANALSFYMYNEYQKDNSFINKIEKLNNAIEDLSLEECLNIIGIVDFYENGLADMQNLDKIKESIEQVKANIIANDYPLVRSKQKAL